ncbi:hypothetical protein, partial [Pseudomonas aeruginosa]|uniref:hypothetical protein n=1 Tax=Pseudomonas aeruginosa TaxID=287 RepID=UPI001968F7C2
MKAQEEIFEIIRTARQRIKQLPSRSRSKATDDDYVREYNRMVGDEGADPEKRKRSINPVRLDGVCFQEA